MVLVSILASMSSNIPPLRMHWSPTARCLPCNVVEEFLTVCPIGFARKPSNFVFRKIGNLALRTLVLIVPKFEELKTFSLGKALAEKKRTVYIKKRQWKVMMISRSPLRQLLQHRRHQRPRQFRP
jgi:hypothetical protein